MSRTDAVAKADPRYRWTAEEKAKLFGVRCPPEEDTARQEFKADADMSNILARFGAGAAFPQNAVYADPSQIVDYTITKQEAMAAVREADAAYARLPEELRATFRSWSDLAAATVDGRLASWESRVKATKEELEIREKAYQAYRAAGGGSPGAGEASPSESAAEGPRKGGRKGDKPA